MNPPPMPPPLKLAYLDELSAQQASPRIARRQDWVESARALTEDLGWPAQPPEIEQALARALAKTPEACPPKNPDEATVPPAHWPDRPFTLDEQKHANDLLDRNYRAKVRQTNWGFVHVFAATWFSMVGLGQVLSLAPHDLSFAASLTTVLLGVAGISAVLIKFMVRAQKLDRERRELKDKKSELDSWTEDAEQLAHWAEFDDIAVQARACLLSETGLLKGDADRLDAAYRERLKANHDAHIRAGLDRLMATATP